MADFTAKDVKALRDISGAGMMDCKKALTEADGDAEAAGQLLREWGLDKAAKRTDRDSSEGAVAMAIDGTKAALVLLRCETDFSAKSDDFIAVAQLLADKAVSGVADPAAECAKEIEDLKLTKKENIDVGQVSVIEATDGGAIDTYLHVQDGRGVNGVIVEGSGIDADTLHTIALHVAFAKPSFLSKDEVPADAAEKERQALLDITKAEGKPEQAWEKIVDGRLSAWYKESVLLEQGLNGEKTTVAQTIGDGSISRFAQVFIGS